MAFFHGNGAVAARSDGWTKRFNPALREYRYSTVTLRNIPTAAELKQEGWKYGPPATLPLGIIVERQQSCARSICRRCGRGNMHYRPWHRLEWLTDKYVEFAVCPSCNFVEELR